MSEHVVKHGTQLLKTLDLILLDKHFIEYLPTTVVIVLWLELIQRKTMNFKYVLILYFIMPTPFPNVAKQDKSTSVLPLSDDSARIIGLLP